MDKVLTVLGRTFIGAGVLVFLFVGYQLWGTGLTEAREQNRLQAEAEQAFADVNITSPTDTTAPAEPGETPQNTAAPAPPPAPAGSAVAIMRIPKIGLEKAIVAGVAVDDLKKGPGHYPTTPLPGQPGNSAIAGHRTTYGAPFEDIDKLGAGDVIEVTTRQGTFRYVFRDQKIVDPTNVSVLNPTDENILTLTTCHPKFSAAKRMIVTATLDTNPAPAAPPAEEAPTTTAPPADGETPATTAAPEVAQPDLVQAGLSGEAVSKTPVAVWAAITFLVGLAIALLARLFNRWVVYGLGSPVFLIVLFIFFENFSRLLPANA